MKIVVVGKEAVITDGKLRGFEGKVVGFDSTINEVVIQLDDWTQALVPSDFIEQDGQLSFSFECDVS